MNAVNFLVHSGCEFSNSFCNSIPEYSEAKNVALDALKHINWNEFISLGGRCVALMDGFAVPMFEKSEAWMFSLLAVSALYIGFKMVDWVARGRCEKKWQLNAKEVRIVSKLRPSVRSLNWVKLESQISDEISERTDIRPFDLGGKTVSDAMRVLKNCEVALDENIEPHFSDSIYTWELSRGEKVSLIRGRDDLYWTVQDPKTGETYQAPFSGYTSSFVDTEKPGLKPYSKEKLINLSDQELINFCSSVYLDLNDKRVCRKSRCPSYHSFLYPHYHFFPYTVSMSRVTASSRFDESVKVSFDYWAVTMINFKGTCNANHSQIVVEGIKNGKYFVRLAEHTGAKIKIRDFSNEDLGTNARSAVFVRSAEETQVMLDAVEKEEGPAPFSLFGGGSVLQLFSGSRKAYHNCFTWAMEKLEMLDIRMPLRGLDLLVSVPLGNISEIYDARKGPFHWRDEEFAL